jgi:hypothetical protein
MKTTQNLIQKKVNFALTPLFVSTFFLVLILLGMPNISEGQSTWLDVPKLDSSILPIPNTEIQLSINYSLSFDDHYGGTLKVELLSSTVTNHRGTCINHGSETTPDLKLRSTNNLGWNQNTAGAPLTRSVTSLTVSPISVNIYCNDSAAYGEVRVTLTLDSGSSLVAYQKIPRDDNGNEIADGWENDATKNYTGNEDAETGPTGTTFIDHLFGITHIIPENTNDGDGLTVFDEYRGAMLALGLTPTRFSPNSKDVFVKHTDNILAPFGCGNGGGFPLSCWVIETGRIVNPNTKSRNLAVIAIEIFSNPQTHAGNDQGDDVLIEAYGDAGGHASVPGPSEAWPTINIYTARIAHDIAPPGTIGRVISHEIGHCVNLGHCGFFRPDDLCIMYPYQDENRNMFGVHHNADYDLIHPFSAPHETEQGEANISPDETSTTVTSSNGIISTNTGLSSNGCDYNAEYDYCSDTGSCTTTSDPYSNGSCGHRHCLCANHNGSETSEDTSNNGGDTSEDTSSNTIISTNTGLSSNGCDYNAEHDYCSDTGSCTTTSDPYSNGPCGHRYCLCAQ